MALIKVGAIPNIDKEDVVLVHVLLECARIYDRIMGDVIGSTFGHDGVVHAVGCGRTVGEQYLIPRPRCKGGGRTMLWLIIVQLALFVRRSALGRSLPTRL